MQVVRTRAELRAALAGAPRPVGLVPTMGWLHAGHVALVERARAESATVVVSIFVNPRQFGEASDFAQYPRNEARDLATCEAAGVDLVFAPTRRRGLPARLRHDVSRWARSPRPLEGAARPGHFDGVATVVAILFALVGAERAYFGLKDYQQVRVIRRMALDLALPTEVVAAATRSASRTASPSRRATRASRRPGGRPRRSSAARCSAGAACVRDGERDAAAIRAVDAAGARPGAAGRRPTTSRSPIPRRSRSWRPSATPARCCRWRSGSRASA